MQLFGKCSDVKVFNQKDVDEAKKEVAAAKADKAKQESDS